MKSIQLEPINIIGITIRTANNDYEKLNNDMQTLWGKFISECISDKISNKIDNDIYCIYTDYEGDYTQPYLVLLGHKVDNLTSIPDGLIGRRFSRGTYVRKSVKGNLLKGIVFEAWQNIWDSDLDRAYIADFEIYGSAAQNPEDAKVEILVGIK